MLHKNTVQYRVRKAEESLPRPFDQDRLHVELALLASQWLGDAALRPPLASRGPASRDRTDSGGGHGAGAVSDADGYRFGQIPL